MRIKIFILGLIYFFISILFAQDEWTTVYVKTGDNIFHLPECKKLEGYAKTGMSLGYAVKKGYKPCDECLKNFNLNDFIESRKPRKSTTIKEDIISRRDEYVKTHSFLSKEIKEAILNGDILIGMNQEQVIASRGKPLRVNKTTTQYGVSEQWIMYENGPYSWDLRGEEYKYIYFENGKVTAWQSEK